MRWLAALLAMLAAPAAAQEGWPVARATSPGARMVVVLRTSQMMVVTLTLPSDGTPLVIPLPGPIDDGDVRSVPLEVLTELDGLTATTLVGYVELDPCASVGGVPESTMGGGGTGYAGRPGEELPPVRVEGHHLTARHDVEHLAAGDVAALETWIAAHHAGLPGDLPARLRPHVEAAAAEGHEAHVLVVTPRPDSEPAAVQLVLRGAAAVPLGIASGPEDVLLIALARFRRQRVAGDLDLFAETDVDVMPDAARDLDALHRAMLERLWAEHPGTFVTETARIASMCVNCAENIEPPMLATLGADVAFPRGFSRRWVMPDADVASVQIEGALTEPVARRVLRRVHPQIAFCFEQAVLHFPSLGGDAALRLTVAPEGRVTEAHVEHDGWAEPVLTECMLRAGGRWTFPAPGSASTVVVSYRFSRGEEEGATRIEDWAMSRLRARLPAEGAATEVTLEDAPPVRGGSEVRAAGEGGPEVPDFHTRYVVRQPWAGTVDCESPIRDRWIDPPSRDALVLPPPGHLSSPLSVLARPPAPELEPAPAPPSPPAASPPAPRPDASPGCACTAGRPSASGPWAVAIAALALLNRRRRIG